jgi:hypothetical protein
VLNANWTSKKPLEVVMDTLANEPKRVQKSRCVSRQPKIRDVSMAGLESKGIASLLFKILLPFLVL